MVGKHIFVRCRNEQNMAGTWTAAMTERIVDKDIVRNYIEPRCNMDETFAQNTLMTCPTNNILRIYYVNGTTLVVTRTYWVTDRITETQGRKGAYSVSYILTGEDVAGFCTDYAGAFDTDCFENYDSLVARTLDTLGNRITISDRGSIFSHKELIPDSSVLAKCSFTKDSFVAFMNGLYDAVENKKQLAVILPKNLRDAWEGYGDDTAEKLGHYVLGILPDFMRVNVGMVSHWSCQIKDKMVGDMPLIFVHPKNDEEIAYMKREGAHILDLDTGRFTTDIPNVAENYFSFVWDNAGDMSACFDFWSYCKTNYKKLLRGRPTSASAMECIYLIRETMAENYKNSERCKKALLLSANEFAGAGTRVPMAEEFISAAIAALGVDQGKVEKDTEHAISYLVSNDGERTKHQLQEYKILLNAIEQGTASSETVSVLSGEVVKDNRSAIAYFLSYLTDKQDLSAEQISLQMTRFVAKLFVNIFQNGKTAGAYELVNLIIKVVKNWTLRLMENKEAWQEFVTPFVEAYIACAKSEEQSSLCVNAAYEYLCLVFFKSEGEMHEVCKKALLKEEIRIYKNPSALLDNGRLRMVEYANAFLDSFYMIEKASKDAILSAYERLFRMIFIPAKEISDKAIPVYRENTFKLLEGEKNDFSEKISSFILKCEENALKDKPPIWNEQNTEKIIILVEYVNLYVFESYYPSAERFSFIAEHLRKDNDAIYLLFSKYASKMPFDVRQAMYKVLQQKDMLVRFYIHMFLNTNEDNIKREIESLIGLNHTEMLNDILTYHDAKSENKEAAGRFSSWYKDELSKEPATVSTVDQKNDFAKQYRFILEELKVFNSFNSASSELIKLAYDIFFDYVYDVFCGLTAETIGKLPLEVINNILFIQSKSTHTEPLLNASEFELGKHLDSVISSVNTQKLYETCEKYLDDKNSCSIIKDRMAMQLKAGTCGSEMACKLYYTMLEMGNAENYPLDRFLNRMDYESLGHLERGNLLVETMMLLHSDKAAFERDAGIKIMNQLEIIAKENPAALLGSEFIGRWKLVKSFDYTKGTGFVRIMNAAAKNHTVRFDLKMLFFCFIGIIAVSLIMGLVSFGIINLATVGSIVMVPVAAIVIIAFCLVDTFLFISLLKSKNRRKQR